MEPEVMEIETPPPSVRASRPRSVMSNSSTSTIKSQSAQKKTVNKTPVRKTPVSKKKKRTKKQKQEQVDSESDGEPIPDEEFVVEQILDKQIVEGQTKYWIKWKNWDKKYNSWEPVENLTNCPVLMEEFEAKHARKSVAKKRPKPIARSGYGYQDDTEDDTAADIFDEFDQDMDMDLPILTSYPENKQLAKIYQVGVVDGMLTFLVVWKAPEDTKPPQDEDKKPIVEEITMIRAECLNTVCPQEVIDFYQERVSFRNDEDSEVHSAAKAARSLKESRERRYITTKKRQRCEELQHKPCIEFLFGAKFEPKAEEEEELEDPAAQAIEAEKNGYGKFDPDDESGLSSSSSESDGSDNRSDE